MLNQQGTIRIIGGRFRGKKITFPIQASLRPTQDRIRETLFNWLMYDIVGANCLDLFTGTGALALEALSRGASHVTCVDSDMQAIQALKKNAAAFNTEAMTLICARYKKTLLTQTPFNIVFIDPPFQEQLHVPAAEWLESQHYLAEKALIYIEAKKGSTMEGLPKHWMCSRHSSTSTVDYYLFRRS